MRLLVWLKALVLDLFFAFFCIFLSFFKKFSKNLNRYNKDNIPILFIHGYMHHSVVFLYMIKTIKKAGYNSIFTINLNKPFSSIEVFSQEMKIKVTEIKKNTNSNKIHIIAHSMGGVVAAYYALFLDKEESIDKLITICSPLNGTYAAFAGAGKCAYEMRKNSIFINNLNKKILEDNSINFYHIATKTDQLIIPYKSALTNKKLKKEFIFDGIGHAKILFTKKVVLKVLEFLS